MARWKEWDKVYQSEDREWPSCHAQFPWYINISIRVHIADHYGDVTHGHSESICGEESMTVKLIMMISYATPSILSIIVEKAFWKYLKSGDNTVRSAMPAKCRSVQGRHHHDGPSHYRYCCHVPPDTDGIIILKVKASHSLLLSVSGVQHTGRQRRKGKRKGVGRQSAGRYRP